MQSTQDEAKSHCAPSDLYKDLTFEKVKWHLLLDFVIECQTLYRQQIPLTGMIGFVGVFHTHKPFFQCWVKVIIQEISPIFKTFFLHHLFDAHFFVSYNPYKFNNIIIVCTNFTDWIQDTYMRTCGGTYGGTCGVTCRVCQIGLHPPWLFLISLDTFSLH